MLQGVEKGQGLLTAPSALLQLFELPATAGEQRSQHGESHGFEHGNAGHGIDHDMQRITHIGHPFKAVFRSGCRP